MMKKRLALIWVLLFGLIGMVGCSGGGEESAESVADSGKKTGELAFRANGEDFVRSGFTSKDGWDISFEHVYVNLSGITAYQTDPPYDSESGAEISGTETVGLAGEYNVDLAAGDENAEPILVGKTPASAGHYNAISWAITNAAAGISAGHNLVMVGQAEKDGEVISFTIKSDKEYRYSAGEYVGEARKGIVNDGGEAEVEMTFHFDHIFGDAGIPADDGLNVGALGFEPFGAMAAAGRVEVDGTALREGLSAAEYDKWLRILPNLGHVGEGHARAQEL